MRRYGLASLIAALAWGQVQDDFSDGDFTNNPPWSGTDAYWTVTPDQRLRSNGPAATATLYLSTPNAQIHNTEWRFWVRVAFNPSTQNYVRVYLVADRSDLTDPALQGYYLKLGGISGTTDSLELWLQQGSTHTRLAGGRVGRFGGTNNILRLRVLRDGSGHWQAYSDTSGFWEMEFSVTDATLTSTAYFGVYFQHTSTNRQNFYLDEVYVGPPIVDTTAPQLLQAQVLTPTLVRLRFSEALNPATATDAARYELLPGPLPITSVSQPSPSQVDLTLGQSLVPSQLYTLRWSGLEDLSANASSGQTTLVLPEAPQPADLGISELLPKPTPVVGLPPHEYVELHNRSSRWLTLAGCRLCDATQCALLPDRLLPPGAYLLLVPSSAVGDYPDALPLSPWPTLNDSGDSLTLWNADDELLDQVVYSSRWYRDPSKASGGWSLERIDLTNLCATDSNWIASRDPRGGTPAQPNSVAGLWSDQTPPSLLEVAFPLPDQIRLRFSEPLDTAAMQDPSRYTLSGGLTVQSVQIGLPEEVALSLSAPLQPSQPYTLRIQAQDCQGNTALLEYLFGLPEPPQPYDLIFTEIMADPDPPVALPPFEYVELYNRSNRYLDLRDLALEVNGRPYALPAYLLRPGQYVVLTSPEGAVAFQAQGVPAIGLSSFPSLLNSGATLRLRAASGALLEEVTYSSSWYRDPAKDEGGWSLERLYIDWLCGTAENWQASLAAAGGTPGHPNSFLPTEPIPPVRISQLAYEPPYLILRFSERLDSAALADPGRYRIQPELPLLAAEVSQQGQLVRLLPMHNPQENELYQVCLEGGLSCDGGPLPPLCAAVRIPAPVTPGDLVINEILPQPQSGGSRYIELYNRSRSWIDLKTLLLARGSPPTRHQPIATETRLLGPGEYLCVTPDTADVQARYLPPPHARFHRVQSLPAYDYKQDTVWLLRTADSLPIDYVPYQESYHFPDLRSTRGVALERLSPERPSLDPQNWYSAASHVRYGTPGYPNSQREPPTENAPIRLEPRTFSPDGDGYDDLLWIYVWAQEPETRADVAVYTLRGHLVRHLAEGTLLSPGENRFRWEGTDAGGQRLPAGLYVVHITLTRPRAGQVHHYRLPCAIAEKVR